MKTVLKNILKQNILKWALARPSLELCANLPLLSIIKIMRELNEIQLSHKELRIISNSVKKKAPCNFLVFGLGNDSLYWTRINRSGTTVFVEDNEWWSQEILKRDHRLKIYLIDYPTQRSQWKELLELPGLLDMVLPKEIAREKWDTILVDAPAGWDDSSPGRMQSIFLSSRLADTSSDVDVFVHDCNRQVEKIYCDRFLKKENLKAEVGLLRHYHITNRYN